MDTQSGKEMIAVLDGFRLCHSDEQFVVEAEMHGGVEPADLFIEFPPPETRRLVKPGPPEQNLRSG